jgi:hypothetical protein
VQRQSHEAGLFLQNGCFGSHDNAGEISHGSFPIVFVVERLVEGANYFRDATRAGAWALNESFLYRARNFEAGSPFEGVTPTLS